MNKLILIALLFLPLIGYSQKPCEIETNATNNIGITKAVTIMFLIFFCNQFFIYLIRFYNGLLAYGPYQIILQ